MIDFDDAPVFAIPLVDDGTGRRRFREGMLIEGPQGWGEFSPLRECADTEALRWLTAATEVGTVGWPDPIRGRIPVSVTIAAVDPRSAHRAAIGSGCRTVDVAVGARRGSLSEDIARVEAVRDAVGPQGDIRCGANGAWDVDEAVSAIALLDKAADGLQYVEQPCRTLDDLAVVRRRVNVRIAAVESIRFAEDALGPSLKDAADIAVLKCGPLGGVRRALRVAEASGVPSVVSSSMETTIGLSAGLALAGALPELPFACGLGTRPLLSDDLVAGPRSLVPVDGCLPVAPTPPAPDPELLAKYVIMEPGGVLWWRNRLRTLTEQTRPRVGG